MPVAGGMKVGPLSMTGILIYLATDFGHFFDHHQKGMGRID